MGFFDSLADTALGVVGSLVGGERRNSAQTEMSQKQMDFQERMSNTAYQRAMSDMEKAGLNPMLAYKQGAASTPNGSMPILQDTITPAINTGMQLYQAESNVGLQGTQAKLNQTNDQLRQNLIPMSEGISTITGELLKLIETVKSGTGGVDGVINVIGEQYQKMNEWASPEGIDLLKDVIEKRINDVGGSLQEQYNKLKSKWFYDGKNKGTSMKPIIVNPKD